MLEELTYGINEQKIKRRNLYSSAKSPLAHGEREFLPSEGR